MSKKILVGVAWPYANGVPHLGHIAGAYLPSDIFARFHRRIGNDVLMVSGSDAHGTPITVLADQEGVDPVEIVNRFHPRWVKIWEDLGISFDLFTTTMTDNHKEVVQDIFNTLRENDYLAIESTEQFYDEQAERFLPDRYVEGTCPHCKYEKARGDQCENCGKTLDPDELINPRSRISDAVPVKRETKHFFFLLSKLQQPVLDFLGTRQHWRKHVINWATQFVKDGLHDRAITRDLTWGVPLPTDELGEGKRIYVWFEAVIGYLSASKEWSQIQGNPDAWREWWQNPEAETYYFVGKDNIPFHAMLWPAMLIGYGNHNLPTNVPANQYVTFKGAKASKSSGVGRGAREYLDVMEPDSLRYALTTVLPEQNDTDLSDDDLTRRVNDELVAIWGNLVNRVFSLIAKNFEGAVPTPGVLDSTDTDLLDRVDDALQKVYDDLIAVEERAGLRDAMEAAGLVNAYLSEREPWKTAKTDPQRTATTLYVALQAIGAVSTMLSPFLPFTVPKVEAALGLSASGWQRSEISAGTKLGDLPPLYKKIDGELFPEED